MIELVRIVEHQASLSSYRATQNEERAFQLELLIEATKPENFHSKWHPLIATPFRYNPPHPHSRFRPPFGKNVFYGSLLEETALYEHGFHFMRERRHLKIKTDTGIRTIFFVDADENNSIHLGKHENCKLIMNKNDYSASQHFVADHPQHSFIIYPSCRDPEKRNNAAVLDINHLEKNPKWESAIRFFYDNENQQINWLDYHLHIKWDQVC